MSRNKEYDREEVLNKITKIFWENGYVGTSMNTLVSSTGLGKRSMYQEFGSKKQLYIESINNYINNLNLEATSLLVREPLGIKNIIDFLKNRVNYASLINSHGCMIINGTIEKEIIEIEAFDTIQQALFNHEESYFKCLEAAKKNEEISNQIDSKVLAGYLITFSAGLMVMSKTIKNKEELESYVDTALSIILK